MFTKGQKVINRYGKISKVINAYGCVVITTDGEYHPTKLFAA